MVPIASEAAAARPEPLRDWVEGQRRRRRSPVFRLLDQSFGFRLLVAASAAVTVLAVVNRFENCHTNRYTQNCLSSNALAVISINNVESLSIVTAAFLYILEGRKRKRQEHREAMELIVACQQAGVVMSIGRLEALETLNDAGLWLDGLDLHGSQLEGLRAARGRWRGANLNNSVLRGAIFTGSDLAGARFHQADLRDANLRNADLRCADLDEADLGGADLRGADLRGANLREANLSGAQLEGAQLEGAQLEEAHLEAAQQSATALDPNPGPEQPA